ncbi:hypothetical protein GLYMA_11G233200v4 [Glycine max]|uniref:Uncharacterized protein n=2 Tax=Glycine subgen. Soja TaxID=1462606 RepID=A0A0R0HUQ5_SOYBN|nr:hypothetical protein GYH30_031988 [Glycine max]KRH31192.1 hypothetical protein GLYMA_11G233200v4 [Glycine max]RZB73043.1 hypothetical protein D0Y65_037001 [Glycine soja]
MHIYNTRRINRCKVRRLRMYYKSLKSLRECTSVHQLIRLEGMDGIASWLPSGRQNLSLMFHEPWLVIYYYYCYKN